MTTEVESIQFLIFRFAPITLKTVVISIIVVLFFLGSISILLAPEEEEVVKEIKDPVREPVQEKPKVQEELLSPNVEVVENAEQIPKIEVQSPKVVQEVQPPVVQASTPPKPKNDLLLSPGRKSARKKRQTSFFDPSSP